jgi:hypothetical protein
MGKPEDICLIATNVWAAFILYIFGAKFSKINVFL